MVFFNPSEEILGLYLQIGHDRLFPRPLQVIHSHTFIRYFIIHITEKASLNNLRI